MKQIYTLLLSIVVTLVFTACGSRNYNYIVTPSPIIEGSAKFTLNKFTFKLNDSDRNELSNFMNEDEMKNLFETSITRQMKENNLWDKDNGFLIDLEMQFDRRYYYMGNSKSRDSIQLPYFIYNYKIYNRNNQLLATYSIPKSTIDYGTVKGLTVSFQMIAFQRKAIHEIEDIDHISKYLVKTWIEIGE